MSTRLVFRLTFLWTRLKNQISRESMSWTRRRMSRFMTAKRTLEIGTVTASPVTCLFSGSILAASLLKLASGKDILLRADALYDRVQYEELYDYLIQYEDCEDDEVLWRLARASYEKSKLVPSKEEKIKLLKRAKDTVYRALQFNDNNFAAHKWASILTVELAEHEGTKAKIEQSIVSKQHMLKAHAINPKDGTTLYLLGVWCFNFADLSWHQRQLAKILFAAPPNSSFDEALQYFLKAEEVEPNFYSMNLLMLGETYLKLKDEQAAIKYLKRARDYPPKTEEDKQAKEKAKSLLKNLGIAE